MSRPSKGERVLTALRLPADLHERLRLTAEERDTSINHLLIRAACYYLDNCLAPLGFDEDNDPPLLAGDQ